MKVHDATEQSYKNGYEAGKRDAVKHGRWIAGKIFGGSTIFNCSECHREVKVTNDYYGKPSRHVAKYYPYCHCGAKMDLE